jgi:hypothetical protein
LTGSLLQAGTVDFHDDFAEIIPKEICLTALPLMIFAPA